MRGYEREELDEEMEDGYDDYDDEDGYAQEDGEEEYEEEDPKPTKEALEYLELRQRLKEEIRRKNKKKGASSLSNSNDRKRKLPYDNYGSFFGPSQPAISQRVIDESKSFLETKQLTTNDSNPSHQYKKSTSSSASGVKPKVLDKKARIINEARSKVQKLKQTRDYSFLLSDEAETPAPPKAVPQRSMPVPSFEARSAQVQLKGKQASVNNSRHLNGGHGERKPVHTANGQRSSKPESSKLPSTSRPVSSSMDSRRPHSSSNGMGPGRPLGPRAVPSKNPASSERKAPPSAARNMSQNMHKPVSSKSQPPVRSQPPLRSQPSSKMQPSSSKSQQPTSKLQPPLKLLPSTKLQYSSKPQPSGSRQQMEQRRELQGPTKAKILPKQASGLSRPQINKPLKHVSSHRRSPDNRPKKKPMRRYSDDEDEAAIGMIRKMFRYDPNKFADRDDDLSDMEANFDDIMREEQRSSRIARQEDEEQLRLIEEEERRERQKKQRRR